MSKTKNTIEFKSGVTVEVENIRNIIIIDVQDLQKHYGQLLANEIKTGGASVSFYTKKFNSCNQIIALLEGLKEAKSEPVLMQVGEFTPDQIETLIKQYHTLLSIEVIKHGLTTEQIDKHHITKKIVELESILSKEHVNKIYADFLAA